MEAWRNTTARRGAMPGVVGRAASAEQFELNRWAPSGDASEWVEHFWSVRWDLRDKPAFESAVITFPVMHITHEWGEDSPRHGFELPATLAHGVVPRVFVTTISGRGSVVGARFRAGGFAARFQCDAAELTARVIPLDDEFFGAPIQLDDDVHSAAGRLDELIARHHGGPDPVYRQLTELLKRVSGDIRIHRVEQVMTCAPWSERTTQRVFRRYVGVPVKWVLCRYRLQHAAFEIESNSRVEFAELAARLGWYDQAHFTNDFRAMLGCTPGEYAVKHGTSR